MNPTITNQLRLIGGLLSLISAGVAIVGSAERSMDYMIAAIVGMALAAVAMGIGVFAHTTKAGHQEKLKVNEKINTLTERFRKTIEQAILDGFQIDDVEQVMLKLVEEQKSYRSR